MRYLLHQSQLNELNGRQAYLYDIFQVYFLPGKPEGSYIPLVPLGIKGPDVLFITGHTHQVRDYLGGYINQIPEHCIVITSCMGHSFKKFAVKKKSMCLISTRITVFFGMAGPMVLNSIFLMLNFISITHPEA